MSSFLLAEKFIYDFKGDNYLHGLDVFSQVGDLAIGLIPAGSRKALLICDSFPGSEPFVSTICSSLANAGVSVVDRICGAAPNAPREDLWRISKAVTAASPDLLVSFGGGSTIDAVKAANVLAVLGGTVEDYFGTGLVTHSLQTVARKLIPHMAIQTAASSGAHLTKYSNITDLATGQKKLIVDESIVPARSVFDYTVTLGAPLSLISDGAVDGISHALEVVFSTAGKPAYEKVLPISLEAIRLVLHYLPRALKNPQDLEARQALGLATDLGGYCIMLGGTNGAHLVSFSLVDVLSHGRACGLLNPYFTVFFAPAVEESLRKVAAVYAEEGYLANNFYNLSGRELGLAVARAMITFENAVDFPTTLGEVPGFGDSYIQRALAAAKDPQLKMKLENMPIPMTAEMVDGYLGPILQAAKTGRLELIKNVE